MKVPERVIKFLALRRSILGLLGMVVLVGLGERMVERYLPIYLLALGGGPLVVGLLQAVNNLLSAVYSYPGGYLSDRIGIKRSLVVFNLMAMAGFLVVILVPTWQAVIAGSVLFLSWNALSLPATMNLIAVVVPRNKRTMGVSLHSLIRRVPMTLGPLLGGLFIQSWGEQTGVRLAFVVALVMAGVALLLQQRLIESDRGGVFPGSTSPWLRNHPLRLFPDMSPALRKLLLSDVLIRFCEQIPYAFVVVWCMKVIASPVSAFDFGVLTAIEMITAALVYIPVAHFADRLGKKPFVLSTFVFFTLFPLVLIFGTSFWLLVPVFVLRGLKELGEPTRKALILDLCPEDRRATMFGFYYLVRDLIVSAAAFGGAFLWEIAPETNFLSAFAFGAAGTVWFAVSGSDLSASAKPKSI